jgi:polyisoprenoid-binding protein YceI
MRLVLQLSIVLGLTCTTVFLAQAEEPVVYTIDPTRSELVVQLFKAGVGAALAHDHVVRATQYTGQIHGDSADPATASIIAEVQTAFLQADEPTLRQKYGLTGSLSDASRQDIQAAMTAKDQLHVERYPTIRFESTRIVSQAQGQYLVTGELTIRGVTQTVTFPVKVELQGDTLHGWGVFRFRQSNFGYKPYRAFLGVVQNKDEVILHFDVIAAR